LRLTKAQHHEVAVIAAQGVSGAADSAPAAQNITSRFMRPRTFSGRERHAMRPCALEITAGDFAIAAHHRRIAIS
jgi:hypothetical protein